MAAAAPVLAPVAIPAAPEDAQGSAAPPVGVMAVQQAAAAAVANRGNPAAAQILQEPRAVVGVEATDAVLYVAAGAAVVGGAVALAAPAIPATQARRQTRPLLTLCQWSAGRAILLPLPPADKLTFHGTRNK